MVIAGANVRGWRALVMARLFRVDNDPVVATPPSRFQPRVPVGFRAEVIANGSRHRVGWRSPRTEICSWPNQAQGGCFVSDSLHGDRVASTDVFPDGLTQPFGTAFRDGFVYVANTNEVVRFRTTVFQSGGI